MTKTESCSKRIVTTLSSHYRYIAIIWSIEDVQSCRPDLDLEQAWHVLQQCEQSLECNEDFTWQLIEAVAEKLYPEQV